MMASSSLPNSKIIGRGNCFIGFKVRASIGVANTPPSNIKTRQATSQLESVLDANAFMPFDFSLPSSSRSIDNADPISNSGSDRHQPRATPTKERSRPAGAPFRRCPTGRTQKIRIGSGSSPIRQLLSAPPLNAT